MIKSIKIKNYKSIDKAELDLGRVNVFIGENGAGKSNILEAIALAGAASGNKLDNEFLSSRGIRVTRPEFMRSALEEADEVGPISILVTDDKNIKMEYAILSDDGPYPTWKHSVKQDGGSIRPSSLKQFLLNYAEELNSENSVDGVVKTEKTIRGLLKQIEQSLRASEHLLVEGKDKKNTSIRIPLTLEVDERVGKSLFELSGVSMDDHQTLSDFIIYSPENTALRIFEREGQIQPLGINGEGLIKLLTVMSRRDKSAFEHLKKCLKVFGWFEDFTIAEEKGVVQMYIRDGFLQESLPDFDQRSANEGFLFAAFYFTLFSSDLTPKFFAVDNIDASLNPKLCQELMKILTKLAKKHQKQVILTTHNPAVLDGLSLDDDEQRLFIISRGRRGETKVRRYKKPVSEQAFPARMSELFLRGALGGLPKRF